jgi:hypothetical protein
LSAEENGVVSASDSHVADVVNVPLPTRQKKSSSRRKAKVTSTSGTQLCFAQVLLKRTYSLKHQSPLMQQRWIRLVWPPCTCQPPCHHWSLHQRHSITLPINAFVPNSTTTLPLLFPGRKHHRDTKVGSKIRVLNYLN